MNNDVARCQRLWLSQRLDRLDLSLSIRRRIAERLADTLSAGEGGLSETDRLWLARVLLQERVSSQEVWQLVQGGRSSSDSWGRGAGDSRGLAYVMLESRLEQGGVAPAAARTIAAQWIRFEPDLARSAGSRSGGPLGNLVKSLTLGGANSDFIQRTVAALSPPEAQDGNARTRYREEVARLIGHYRLRRPA